MKSIDKNRQADINRLTDGLTEHTSKLETAINAYNDGLAPLKEAVQDAINAYNETLAELRGIYEELHADADAYYSERSERWQGGDNGRQYDQWKDTLNDVDLDDISIELPEDIELPSEVPDWTDLSFLPANSPEEM